MVSGKSDATRDRLGQLIFFGRTVERIFSAMANVTGSIIAGAGRAPFTFPGFTREHDRSVIRAMRPDQDRRRYIHLAPQSKRLAGDEWLLLTEPEF
jgi:hypothetical protein